MVSYYYSVPFQETNGRIPFLLAGNFSHGDKKKMEAMELTNTHTRTIAQNLFDLLRNRRFGITKLVQDENLLPTLTVVTSRYLTEPGINLLSLSQTDVLGDVELISIHYNNEVLEVSDELWRGNCTPRFTFNEDQVHIHFWNEEGFPVNIILALEAET
ncbi:MAG TPA: hypothetical protein VG965_02500 [Patescibacteria group bacterium]|nr:hypothetical protein [Patescibacteria group bacterium]